MVSEGMWGRKESGGLLESGGPREVDITLAGAPPIPSLSHRFQRQKTVHISASQTGIMLLLGKVRKKQVISV